MRQITATFLTVLVSVLLTACGAQEESLYFTGVVSEITESDATVIPNEGEEIRRSGDAVTVSNRTDDGEQLAEGDTIKVEYEGDVMESYPLQINVISIEKMEE